MVGPAPAILFHPDSLDPKNNHRRTALDKQRLSVILSDAIFNSQIFLKPWSSRPALQGEIGGVGKNMPAKERFPLFVHSKKGRGTNPLMEVTPPQNSINKSEGFIRL